MRLFDPRNDDLAVMAALHAASFPDGWSVSFIRDLLDGPGTFAFIADSGFILARVAGSEAEILTITVAPQQRRRGTGRALVRKAASHAQTLGATMLFLEVVTDNEPALKLYVGAGFKPVGLRKAYYQGKDAQILKAALPLPNPGDFA